MKFLDTLFVYFSNRKYNNPNSSAKATKKLAEPDPDKRQKDKTSSQGR